MDLDQIKARLEPRFGPAVHRWVDGLPEWIDELASRWSLRVGPAYPAGNSSVAIRCGPAVLKLFPDQAFAAEQVRTLGMFERSGRVPLVLADEDGAILMEAVEPGTPVTSPPPVNEYAALLTDLHAPGFVPRTLAEWTEEIFIRAEKRGVALGGARLLRDELISSQTRTVVLHGDLHFGNVLNGPRLMVIDPRACVGDPCFDAVDYALAARSTSVAKAAGMDAERLAAWCRVFEWVWE
jgi:streptomycin 6-kinase